MKATQQAQLGYYVVGQEPPIIYETDRYYVCWKWSSRFKVFDRADDRLVESFSIRGLDLDTAKVIAKDYIEGLTND